MRILTCVQTREPITLIQKLADSGEGSVWITQDTKNLKNKLAKLYHQVTPARLEKLETMIVYPPKNPNLAANHITYAWPESLLRDEQGKIIGFLMPRIVGASELIQVYNPSQRQRLKLAIDWSHLHGIAHNFALAVHNLHEEGYVLGDIKAQNILVNDRGLVSIIDTDSFQVRHPLSGKLHHCLVGSPDYTPPELLGKDFSQTEQTRAHDRFRLGVIFYQLLFGVHPFADGKWLGNDDPPELRECLRRGLWPYGSDANLKPGRYTIPLDVVHPSLKALFLACFNDGHRDPEQRPAAERWQAAFNQARQDLVVCRSVESHVYSKHYGQCYWCDRSKQLGTDIFAWAPELKRKAGVLKPPAASPLTQKRSSTPISPQPTSTLSPQPQRSKTPTAPSRSRQPLTRLSGSSLAPGWKLDRRAFIGLGVLAFARIVGRQLLTSQPEPSGESTGTGTSGNPSGTERNPDCGSWESPIQNPDVVAGLRSESYRVQTVINLDSFGRGGQQIDRTITRWVEDLGNGVLLYLVRIPAGTFTMGSPSSEDDRQSDEAQHQVYVPEFWMGQFTVTQAQYQRITGQNPATSSDRSRFVDPQKPIINVYWDDAVDFCGALSQRTGRSYGLPSEAQWEYACRACTQTPFHFGETITPDLVNYHGNHPYANAPEGQYRRETTPVGNFPPNPWGLHDMHGNVWEWCADQYYERYNQKPDALRQDGSIPWTEENTSQSPSSDESRILRGGSWNDDARGARSAFRGGFYRVFALNIRGFRVILPAWTPQPFITL